MSEQRNDYFEYNGEGQRIVRCQCEGCIFKSGVLECELYDNIPGDILVNRMKCPNREENPVNELNE